MVDAEDAILVIDRGLCGIFGLIVHPDQNDLAHVMNESRRKQGPLIQAGEKVAEVRRTD